MKLHRQPAWLLTCLLIASLFVLPDNLIDAQEVQTAKTVEQLADHFGKTVRGVKTVLTRRGLSASDYTPKSAE